VNALRLHLWREWREHRLALLMLFLVLPILGWGSARVPPKAVLGDPLIQSGAALAFVVVLLVATGGELLGADRRGNGLRWLERLPSGLNVAFLAKLLFLAITTTVAAVYGLGVARSIALLRGVEPRAIHWEPISFIAGSSLVLWTFACSAWTLRGGLAIFAAVLVLGAVGYPAWALVAAGYSPGAAEFWTLGGLLLLGGLLAAALGFLGGGRFGRGNGAVTLLGLIPAALLLLTTATWSSIRLAESEAIDPLAKDFCLLDQLITSDGRYAFAYGIHLRPSWDPESMPKCALRIDLRTGAFEKLGRYIGLDRRYREELGHPRADEIIVRVEGAEAPLAFDAADGAPREWDPRKRDFGWFSKGLGFYLFEKPGSPAVIRDPFRGRDHPASEFPRRGMYRLLVRPGRWLCSTKDDTWCWLDPDTKEETVVDWAPGTKPLVVLEDGRVLLSDMEAGLRVVDPEHGTSYALDSQGVPGKDIYTNFDGLRIPDSNRNPEADASGEIILRTAREVLLVIDPELRQVRRLAFPGARQLIQRVGSGFLTRDMNSGALERLDLASGELTRLWPPAR